MNRILPNSAILFLALTAAALAQQPVTIQVDASKKIGAFKPVWNYFGYDEPNYTYMENGQKLIRELASLSKTPVHIRAHNLLTTGDGTPALKWGSTNAYTEDAAGNPVYNWIIVDKILETYLRAGAIPFVEIGFMPKALSTHPNPYRHTFPKGSVFTGWSYPPNNYAKWSELIYQWVKHSVAKYGKAQVETWNWEVWNEPDIGYWHGTPDEYDKLYDYTADAVKRALPTARIGGPATTGPGNAKAAAFLKQFLEHCATGKNYATGKAGAPLDFISYHAKGRPDVVDEHVRMGISKHLRDVSEGFKIVRSFPKFRSLPIVLSESDPEGCAACSARTFPPNAYRNGTLYPAYVAAVMNAILNLATRDHANLEGILTWAFEFEDQPYFDGFRTLATNGVDKPVLNVFRMAGLLAGDRVQASSDRSIDTESMAADGVRQKPDIDVLASASTHRLSVLVWNYQDDDVAGPAASIHLHAAGIPPETRRILIRHYRIDESHSNAYTVWKRMGSPQQPTAEQYKTLESAGQLQLLTSPHWANVRNGAADTIFSLPLHGLSLIELSW